MSRHVVFIVERRAWCSYCDWECRAYNMADVEAAADFHAFVTDGRIKPGWGVNKESERARVAAALSASSGTIEPQLKRRDRPGASTPTAGGLCTPRSDVTGRRVVQP